MEKLIELFFSNIFIIIIVLTGISKLFKKTKGNDYKPDSDGNVQKPSKESTKKFNIFNFDLEKWLEEQAGEKNKIPKGMPIRQKSSSPIKGNANKLPDFRELELNYSTSKEGGPVNKMSNITNDSYTVNEDEVKKQFEVDMTDMQNALVMAEILGPPRSKRKSIRY